jgi:hypothetical protein
MKAISQFSCDFFERLADLGARLWPIGASLIRIIYIMEPKHAAKRPSATSAEAGTEQPLMRRGSTIDLAPNSALRSKRRDFSPVKSN